jgi:hypothetical protein
LLLRFIRNHSTTAIGTGTGTDTGTGTGTGTGTVEGGRPVFICN